MTGGCGAGTDGENNAVSHAVTQGDTRATHKRFRRENMRMRGERWFMNTTRKKTPAPPHVGVGPLGRCNGTMQAIPTHTRTGEVGPVKY